MASGKVTYTNTFSDGVTLSAAELNDNFNDIRDWVDIADEDDMTSNSAAKLPTQQSVKAYVDSGTVTMTNKTLTTPTLTNPVLNGSISGTGVLDEDNMTSDSATALATQQSIKAYVDAQVGVVDMVADTDADTLIQVEESADEDIIRFDTGGTERVRIEADGSVTKGTGCDVCLIKTGTYTGDGTTGQAITGVGFQPKVVIISDHVGHAGAPYMFIKSDVMTAGVANQFVDNTAYSDKIVSLDVDGFTVDDGGGDARPNANGVTYDYIAWG